MVPLAWKTVTYSFFAVFSTDFPRLKDGLRHSMAAQCVARRTHKLPPNVAPFHPHVGHGLLIDPMWTLSRQQLPERDAEPSQLHCCLWAVVVRSHHIRSSCQVNALAVASAQ